MLSHMVLKISKPNSVSEAEVTMKMRSTFYWRLTQLLARTQTLRGRRFFLDPLLAIAIAISANGNPKGPHKL